MLGRLYVDRSDESWLVLDIALLPAYRRIGIGTHLLRELIAEAEAGDKPVQVHVERLNPAKRFIGASALRRWPTRGSTC